MQKSVTTITAAILAGLVYCALIVLASAFLIFAMKMVWRVWNW